MRVWIASFVVQPEHERVFIILFRWIRIELTLTLTLKTTSKCFVGIRNFRYFDTKTCAMQYCDSVLVPSCIDGTEAWQAGRRRRCRFYRRWTKEAKFHTLHRAEHTKARMFILMTATLRLADGRAILAHTQQLGVNEPNKRNANALKSVVRLCCVQWKWKMCLCCFFFVFFKYRKGPRASAFAFACCPLLICLHPLLQFSFSWSVPQPVRSIIYYIFFRKMLAYAGWSEPWNWQNDVRCRPLLCHTFRK